MKRILRFDYSSGFRLPYRQNFPFWILNFLPSLPQKHKTGCFLNFRFQFCNQPSLMLKGGTYLLNNQMLRRQDKAAVHTGLMKTSTGPFWYEFGLWLSIPTAPLLCHLLRVHGGLAIPSSASCQRAEKGACKACKGAKPLKCEGPKRALRRSHRG